MGKFDSSKTRVEPVFDRLHKKDSTGKMWIHELLSLPEYGKGKSPAGATYRILPGDKGTTYGWGKREKKLFPPVSLLRWLVENPPSKSLSGYNAKAVDGSHDRKELLKRNPVTIQKALDTLKTDPPPREWYVLEGLSQPDAYLETDRAIVVVEGKRTEPGPTTSTSWMPVRHQMLRHIDCAWEIRKEKSVYGFFIVEGNADGGIPAEWVLFSRDTFSASSVNLSLPHRSADERGMIAECFLGVTTWQRVCGALNLDFKSLPHEC